MKARSILEINKDIKNGSVSPYSLWEESCDKARKYQDDYNSFVTILSSCSLVNNSDSLLNGISYALKDNISTKGILTTASSNILSDYVPVYDATVYKKLRESGALLVGKTVMDELAMGGTGTTGHTGVVRNPYDKSRMVGGSSSGSASSVALSIVSFAIGSDTGDSIRKPAGYTGVVGFKPTYGRVSRYGLFPFASSLDHVGVLGNCVSDVAIVMDVIKGYDPKDMTSLPDDGISYFNNLGNDVKGKKLCYIKEFLEVDNPSDELRGILDNFKVVLDYVRSIGIEVHEVSVDKKLLYAIYPTYNIISCAESTSNNANLTGVLYGPRSSVNDLSKMIMENRTKGFSPLIKRRFVIGSYVLQKENQEKLFLNACRVRRMIVDRINELFLDYDGLILPSAGSVAPKLSDCNQNLSSSYLLLDNHLEIGNFGGMPSITIPCGFVNGMPIGVNITGRVLEDDLVLNMAYKLESVMPYVNMIVGEDDV